MLGRSHLSVVFAIDFGEDMASKSRPSFDLAAFFDLETLDGALDTFHFWHRFTPFQLFFRSGLAQKYRKWEVLYPNKLINSLRDQGMVGRRGEI